ncbi:hypothetical protein [Dialister invisus]|uniref:hypothetical protein n=1 Tax=Dialister invisus TaxID=218538 RepID=UPI00399F3C9C
MRVYRRHHSGGDLARLYVRSGKRLHREEFRNSCLRKQYGKARAARAKQEAEAAEKKKKEEAEKKKALKDKVKSAGNKLLDRISGRSAEKSGEKQ